MEGLAQDWVCQKVRVKSVFKGCVKRSGSRVSVVLVRKKLKWLRVLFLFPTSTFLRHRLFQSKSGGSQAGLALWRPAVRQDARAGCRRASKRPHWGRCWAEASLGARISPGGPEVPALPPGTSWCFQGLHQPFLTWGLRFLILYLSQSLSSSSGGQPPSRQCDVSNWQSIPWPWIHDCLRLKCWRKEKLTLIRLVRNFILRSLN